MRLLILLLVITSSAWATTYTAVTSANWNVTSTWSPSGVPGNGDSVSIPDGLSVTCPATVTCIAGTNTAGSAAINLHATGYLIVNGTLVARGHITYTNSASNTSDGVRVNAGGVLEFDSSLTASPFSVHYFYQPADNTGHGYRPFRAIGTPASHATTRSNAGGGAGGFSLNGYTGGSSGGGPFQSLNADFLRIGDASTHGWEVNYDYGGAHPVFWDVELSSFISCGMISSASNSQGVDNNGTFVHFGNWHKATAATSIFDVWLMINNSVEGNRQIAYNSFDVSLSPNMQLGMFHLIGNYMENIYGASGPFFPASQIKGNFIRYGASSTQGLFAPLVEDTYLYFDADSDSGSTNNPHFLGISSAQAQTYSGLIAQMSGIINGDSGEVLPDTGIAGSAGWNYDINGSILLPASDGKSPAEWSSIEVTTAGYTFSFEHNTAIGGALGGGFNTVDLEEGHVSPTGVVSAYKSNIVWAPTAGVSFGKVGAAASLASTSSNVCLPANCDFNTGWNMSATGSYTNSGKGYNDNFTATPGAHDVDVDPQFVDPTRNLEAFDRDYFGNTSVPVWNSGATYAAGNVVSSSDSTIWGGKVFNYRYKNGPGCSGANPKPGLINAASRACWEANSLNLLRTNVGAQARYTDYALGVYNQDIITLLIRWVRAGYAPQNLLLAGSGHDGLDIGAAAVYNPQSTTPPGASSTSVVQGGVLKGWILK